jgi:hypothetical protein
MGYVAIEHSNPETELIAVQRNKKLAVRVHKGPFYTRSRAEKP